MSPPPIKGRGLRGMSIPPGFILGRLSGTGDAQLLDLQSLKQFGLATINDAVLNGPVKSVFGRSGAVVATTGDYTIAQITNGLSNALTDTHIFVGNGSGIATGVALSGDATLADTGALTLATVNSNVGTFGDATHVSQVTVDAKGRVTAASNVAITAGGSTNFYTTFGAGSVTLTRGAATNTAVNTTAPTSARTLTLDDTGAQSGDIWYITCKAGVGFTTALKDSGSGLTLVTINNTSNEGMFIAVYNGTTWQCMFSSTNAGGNLG